MGFRAGLFVFILFIGAPSAHAGDGAMFQDRCLREVRYRMTQITLDPTVAVFDGVMDPSCPSENAGLTARDVGNLADLTRTPRSPGDHLSPYIIPGDCQFSVTSYPVCIPGVTTPPTGRDPHLTGEQLRVSRIISVGESYAGFVDGLREAGLEAYGVDIDDAYRHPERDPTLRGRAAAYAWGNVTALSHHPLVHGHLANLVTSFCLFCALPPEVAVSALEQSALSLAPGGEARHVTFLHGQMAGTDAAMAALTALRARLGARASAYDVELHRLSMRYRDDERSGAAIMLRIRRHAAGEAPAVADRCPRG